MMVGRTHGLWPDNLKAERCESRLVFLRVTQERRAATFPNESLMLILAFSQTFSFVLDSSVIAPPRKNRARLG